MGQTLDIFKEDLAGSLLWVEAVVDVEAAKIRVRELTQSSPEKYIVFSQQSQTWLDLETGTESSKEFST
jgi:hypothetical protein